MGKTRDLFKKIGDIKGTFPERMDTIKDRNSKDIAEAKEIKKKWQEYTEGLYVSDPTVVVIQVIKTFFFIALLCILATFS